MVKVSVIIPVYNASNYLKESLNSILNQTLDDIEVICVDDDSQDNSYHILVDFASKNSNILVLNQKHEYPFLVAVVIPAHRLNLDMLTYHIESEIFRLSNIIKQRFVSRRRIECREIGRASCRERV